MTASSEGCCASERKSVVVKKTISYASDLRRAYCHVVRGNIMTEGPNHGPAWRISARHRSCEIQVLRFWPLRPHVRRTASVRVRHARDTRGAAGYRQGRRHHGRQGQAGRRPGESDHQPGAFGRQPGQSKPHRRVHVSGPVHRSRRDVRPDLQPGTAGRPGAHLELPYAQPGARQRLRLRARRQPAPL